MEAQIHKTLVITIVHLQLARYKNGSPSEAFWTVGVCTVRSHQSVFAAWASSLSQGRKSEAKLTDLTWLLRFVVKKKSNSVTV